MTLAFQYCNSSHGLETQICHTGKKNEIPYFSLFTGAFYRGASLDEKAFKCLI